MVVLIGVMSYKTFRNELNVLQKFALYVSRKLILSFVIWNLQNVSNLLPVVVH